MGISVSEHTLLYPCAHCHSCREVALRTENYQPGDLETLVERAISHAELRTLNPLSSLTLISIDSSELPPDSPRYKVRSHNNSASTPERELGGIDIPGYQSGTFSYNVPASSPPLATPPPVRKVINQGGMPYSREDSAQTVVFAGSPPTLRKNYSLSCMRLRKRDFLAALEGFVPVSLRGLPLHSAGSVDFSHIGGLDNVKGALRETLSWPSKVLFKLLLSIKKQHFTC